MIHAPADTMLLFTAQTYSNEPWTMLDCIAALESVHFGSEDASESYLS